VPRQSEEPDYDEEESGGRECSRPAAEPEGYDAGEISSGSPPRRRLKPTPRTVSRRC
jgi:hypothetical protein